MAKQVFATYMPGMAAYGKTIANFREEIREALALGIDGFAINVPLWSVDPKWKTHTANIYEAARQQSSAFKLFMMPGFGGSGISAADVVNMVSLYVNHPNQLKFQGRPVLTSFVGQNEGEVFWRDGVIGALKRKGINPFFIPQAPCTYKGVRMNTWPVWADPLTSGHMYWAVRGGPEELASVGEAVSNEVMADGKTFMSGVSPCFWHARPDTDGHGRYYFEHRGGEGLAVQWDSILHRQQTAAVMLCTWNDYSESYFSPVDTTDRVKAPIPNFGIRDLLKPHKAFAELNKYYVDWYKTGIAPAITQDRLFYFYRVHPAALKTPNDIDDVTLGTDCPDDLFITTMLTAPAVLTVSTGGRVTSHNIGVGIRHTRVPFLPGAQNFTLTRSVTVLQGSGEPILSQIERYNFIPTSGVI